MKTEVAAEPYRSRIQILPPDGENHIHWDTRSNAHYLAPRLVFRRVFKKLLAADRRQGGAEESVEVLRHLLILIHRGDNRFLYHGTLIAEIH